MKRHFWISSALLAILLQLQAWNCFQLSDAPYPVYMANPQRTGAVNKPVLCPDISQGRSTVLREAQSFFGDGYINKQPVIDADGSIYVAWFGSTSVLYKFDANLTVVMQVNLAASPASAPTILEEGVLVSLVNSEVHLYKKSDLTQIGSWTLSNPVHDLLPYGNLLLGASSNGFYIFNTSTTLNPSGNGVLMALYNNIIYGIDQVTNQVFESPDGSIINKYSPPQTLIDFTPSIFGDQLVAFDGTNAQLLNLTSHQFTTIPTNNFVELDVNAKFYKDGKLYYPVSCLAGTCLGEATTNTIYELISVDQEFVYSVNDDVLLAGGSDYYRLTGLHLASQKVKLAYQPFSKKKRALASPMHPIIGDNCVQYYANGGIYKLEPLPLQRIMPIFECIDSLDRMYFTYNSLESDTVTIPRVSDRNDLPAMNFTPFTDFEPGRLKPYPLSDYYFTALGGVDIYTWYLEDYVLTFNKSDPRLKCPTTFNLLITIRSTKAILPIHLRVMEHVFCVVKGISPGRVAIKPISAKRSAMQDNTLEAELAIYPTNSTTSGEPSSRDVTQSFVSEQAASVNQAFFNDTALPSDTEIVTVSAKELENSVVGTQVVPPVAAPTAPTAPTTQPQPSPSSIPISISPAPRVVQNLALSVVFCCVIFLF